MDALSLSQHHDSAITSTSSPKLLCRLHDMAKRIIQLRKNGDNFNIWERQLTVTIRSLTGSTSYLSHSEDQHDRHKNEVVFNLIFWSIDEDLQLDLNINGSAKDAFRVLAARFNILPSSPQAEGITSRRKIAGILQIEEISQNIVDIVHAKSLSESNIIKEREMGRMEVHEPPTWSGKGPAYKVYYDHRGPPILNTFQNLAVVNRMFQRLCLPKLWQKIRFPSALPGPMSLWTEMLLPKYGEKVKSFEFELAGSCLDRNSYNFMESEKYQYDNTVFCAIPASQQWAKDVRYGIRPTSVQEILKSCTHLESVSVIIPHDVSEGQLSRLGRVLEPVHLPQLQTLKLENRESRDYMERGDLFVMNLLRGLKSLVSLELHHFRFRQEETIEESLGWNLARQTKLRNIRFEQVTCEDGTWTLNTWLYRLETLELDSCPGLSTRVVHGLLSGSAPSLTRLHLGLGLGHSSDKLDVDAQFDLPILKELTMDRFTTINLLSSFDNCKDIELVKCGKPVNNELWELMKQHLSRSTWPKLSVLSLPRANGIISKEDVDEIRDAHNIKLLID